MIFLFVVIVICSILLGLAGRKRKFGFWGYFFASLLLTPLVGILLVMASEPPPKQKAE